MRLKTISSLRDNPLDPHRSLLYHNYDPEEPVGRSPSITRSAERTNGTISPPSRMKKVLLVTYQFLVYFLHSFIIYPTDVYEIVDVVRKLHNTHSSGYDSVTP